MKNIYKTITKMGICSLVIAGLVFSPVATEAASAKSYQYDTSGRLQSITLPGYKITFTYDKNGNLLKRSVVKAAVTK
ncbi:YD repeat-containing protein [Paenibacillus sp. SORGH_AS306]|uniref:RHS repeat domain-containing protein n=1 Tax=unclassified Paenibacillus TaxID=185978 RepID=UPI00277FCBDA|nr:MULTISPECIES: RHS repeat domain-containing protein [unclassified Paenibacillus]MDQ1236453.1 YD repeat-containing protein [Paenibacillus sp. SORGH_AS_0306]MDR6108806.1 YD repeat-containing protein [Paenibacillus sp. SORGH_AS_0338]